MSNFRLTVSAMVKDNISNGTSITSEVDGDSRPPLIAFLACLMLVSCAGNVFLLYASVRLRKVCYNVQSITIINLVAVCLADCLLNMSLVMGSLVEGSDWDVSNALCKWHAFTMNLVLVETMLLLTVLACDRFMAIRFPRKYDSLVSPIRLGIVISLTWIQALAFSVPYFSNVVKVTFQLRLHTCSVSEETPLSFICVALLLCFFAPAMIIIIMFILTIQINCKQQSEVTQAHNSSDNLMEEPCLWHERWSLTYVGILCLMWLILDLPYIITAYILQYQWSSEIGMNYPWSVYVGFMWMKFAFSAMLPCATFIWKKDMYCKECVICHRSNSVLDIQIRVNPNKPQVTREVSHGAMLQRTKNDRKHHSRQELPSLLKFNVPVLFATSDGIHIETPNNELAESDKMGELGEYLPKGRQLDINDHTTTRMDLAGDTSDYDSINEAAYMSSQPLSARHITGSVSDLSTVGQTIKLHGRQAIVADFSATQGMDSGVDLSGSTHSSSMKEKRCLNDTRNKTNIDPARKGKSESNGWMRVESDSEKCDNVQDDRNSESLAEHCNSGSIHSYKKHNYIHSPPYPLLTNINTESKNKGNRKDCDKDMSVPQVYTPPRVPAKLWPLADNQRVKHKRGKAKKSKKTAAKDHSETTMAGNEQTNEAQRKGHKRTRTEDSEKALLGSNSSSEMHALKADKLTVTHSEDNVNPVETVSRSTL